MGRRLEGISRKAHKRCVEGLEGRGPREREQSKADATSLRQGRQVGHMVVSGKGNIKLSKFKTNMEIVHMRFSAELAQLQWLRE
eukprot:10126539-Heterocapsa_arctica.AAC.1